MMLPKSWYQQKVILKYKSLCTNCSSSSPELCKKSPEWPKSLERAKESVGAEGGGWRREGIKVSLHKSSLKG